MRLRYRWLFLFSVIAAISVGSWYWKRASVPSTTPVVEQPSPLLDRHVSLNVNESPLSEVVAQLAREHGLQFTIDQAAMQRVGCTGDEPVTFTMPDIRLGSVLKLLPKQADSQLKLELHGNSIQLTAYGGTPAPPTVIETRLYPLTELMANPHEFDAQVLAEVIQNHIGSGQWGWTGGSFSLEAFPTALLVSATPDVHALIEMLLRRLSDVDFTNFQSLGLEPDCAEQQANRELESRLNESITFDFWRTPLTEVIRWLRDDCHVPILIDHRDLKDLGVSEQSLITLTLHDVSLRSALRWTLSPLELTFEVRNGLLLVTTPSKAEDSSTTRLYPIHDLRVWLDDDLEAFAHLVTEFIGPKPMHMYSPPETEVDFYGGYLIMTHSRDVHDELQNWLDDLRQQAFPYLYPSSSLAESSESVARIEKALSRESTFEADDELLSEVAARLARELNINVIRDQRRLEDLGIRERTTITIPAGKQPLGEILRGSLEPLALGYMVHDDVLLLTSLDRAEEPVTRVYQAADLCGASSHENDSALERFASEVLISDTWQDDIVVELLGTLLVVRTSPSLHQRLGRVLEATRQWRAVDKPDGFCWPGDDLNDAISFYNIAELLELVHLRYNGRSQSVKPWYLEAVPSNRHRPLNDIEEPDDDPHDVEQRITEAIRLVLGRRAPYHCMIFRDGLVTLGSNKQHTLVQTAVDRLRQFLRLEHGPHEIVSLPATTVTSETITPWDYIYFDVQPVLRRHSTLTADRLATFMIETLQPGAAVSRFPGIATLPGLLVLHKYDANLFPIEKVLNYLAFEMEQPAALQLLDSPERTKQAVLDYLTAELYRPELYRRALATRLLREVREPPADVVLLLVQQLSNALEQDDRDLLSLTLMTLAQHGERAASALPFVEIILSRSVSFPDFPNTQFAINVLIACRAKGLPTLERLLSGPDPLSTDYLIQILEGLKDDAQPLTDEILLRIEHERADRLGPALLEIDPAGARSREVLREWRNSPDSATRERAHKIGELVHSFIGD